MDTGYPEGESTRMSFEGGIKLEFHYLKVTSDSGLFAYREPDDALGLFEAASTVLSDQRSGCNIKMRWLSNYANPSIAVLRGMKMSVTPSVSRLILS